MQKKYLLSVYAACGAHKSFYKPLSSLLLAGLLLSACGTTPSNVRNTSAHPKPEKKQTSGSKVPVSPTAKKHRQNPDSEPPISSAPPPVKKRKGGYYEDDGPDKNPPKNIDQIPGATPRWEPIYKPSTRSYVVRGKRYSPHKGFQRYKARGIASWYGKKFHGRKTANGERYNMYAMTAASKVLVIPSYARVTNLKNGRSIIVRINDRGPFHPGRIIDLSYSAAHKLDLIKRGHGMVEVESLIPKGKHYRDVAPPTPQKTTQKHKQIEAPRETSQMPTMMHKNLTSGFYLQIGAFGDIRNAESLRAKSKLELGALDKNLVVSVSQRRLYRLLLGPYPDRVSADSALGSVREKMDLNPTVLTVN